MPEKPCEWAENPSGAVWECNAHSTQCAHKHADTNPDGSVNIFECKLGDPAYAFREIKRLQRLTKSYQETVDRLVGVLQERWKPISECWIPVTERLPEHDDYVLVSTIGGFVAIDRYIPEDGEWLECEVKAWMPLPHPYEVKDDD